jgi:hypothetical protein
MSVAWSESLELLFKKSAEHFLCLRWTHDAAQRWCATRNSWLSIPVIVLSGLAGLGSVGSDSILPFQGAAVVVGFVSWIAGTLQTISAYYEFSRRAEAHRIAALNYEKLHRLIDFELKIDRAHRTPADQLIKQLKEEANRLNEISPQLPTAAIVEFKKAFPHAADDIAVPALLNGLEAVTINTTEAISTPLTHPPENSRVRVSLAV